MKDVFQSNPYLFISFLFFLSFIVIFLLYTFFKKVYLANVEDGKIPKDTLILFRALKECHFGNLEEYLDILKKLAKKYPEETEIFIMAGDVVRKSNPQKALEIHRELLFRSEVSGKLRATVLKHVGKDYLELGKYTKAQNSLSESVKISDNGRSRQLLSKAYESTGDFKKAFENMKKSLKMENNLNEKILRNMAARFAAVSDNIEEKTIWLGELKSFVSPKEGAVLSLSKSVFDGKQRKAQSQLKDIIDSYPDMEVSARSVLSNANWGKEVNSEVEGKYMKIFRKNFDEAVFVCGNCSSIIKQEDPVCGNCLSVSVKKIYESPEV